MRAIGKRIQEKVGQAMSRKMIGKLQVRRENQPLRIDCSRFSPMAQIARGLGVVFEQPEYAAVNIFQQDLGHDLAGVVEAAENEALGGQTRLGAAGRDLRKFVVSSHCIDRCPAG